MTRRCGLLVLFCWIATIVIASTEFLFVAGWTYGRRSGFLMSLGDPDEIERTIEGSLETSTGRLSSFRLKVLISGPSFCLPRFGPIPKKRPSIPLWSVTSNPNLEKRGLKNVKVVVAVLGSDAGKLDALLKERPSCEVVLVPGGVNHPFVKQFGVLDEDERANALVVDP